MLYNMMQTSLLMIIMIIIIFHLKTLILKLSKVSFNESFSKIIEF